MAKNKSFTDLEQCRKLATILPPESADMCYIATADDDKGDYLYTAEYKSEFIFREDDEDCISCWSLAALLDNIPQAKLESVKVKKRDKPRWKCYSFFDVVIQGDPVIDWYVSDWCDNPIDACYDVILQLNESTKI